MLVLAAKQGAEGGGGVKLVQRDIKSILFVNLIPDKNLSVPIKTQHHRGGGGGANRSPGQMWDAAGSYSVMGATGVGTIGPHWRPLV